MTAQGNGNASVLVEIDKTSGNVIGRHNLVTSDARPFAGNVGGLAATPYGLFIADEENGIVRIAPEAISEAGTNGDIEVSSPISTDVRASFCAFDGTLLWVGTLYEEKNHPTPKDQHDKPGKMSRSNHARCIGYAVIAKADGAVTLKPRKAFSIPDKIQGIAFAPNGRIALSQSYGNAPSALLVFDQEFETDGRTIKVGDQDIPLCFLKQGIIHRDSIEKVKIPPYSEGICFLEDSLLVLFSSGAELNRGGVDIPMEAIWTMGLEEFLLEK